MRNILLVLICVAQSLLCTAHDNNTDYSKLSPYVRQMVIGGQNTRSSDDRSVVAFVKTCSGSTDILYSAGCTVYAKMGDVYVVEIPVAMISRLTEQSDIKRIEARRSCSALLDSVSNNVDFASVHAGRNMPQAFTGKGVVMGIMDVGFDLTSPNFYTRDMKDYRIRSFWDQLSEKHDEDFVVGSEYVGRDKILNLKHSRDNLVISHGTHTLGIAAGSGYNSDYIGIAPESDICLVNNAVTEDTVFISEEDKDKFTSATDALGFKYIFDYAERMSQPCVISFSEGSRQGFEEDDKLFYEALESLVGPGKILVASAGNDGQMKLFMQKLPYENSVGTFVYSLYNMAFMSVKSADDFTMLIQSYGNPDDIDSIFVNTTDVKNAVDGKYTIERSVNGAEYIIDVVAVPSIYDSSETVYQLVITSNDMVGARVPLSLQLIGNGSEVELYAYNCIFLENEINPSLCDAVCERTILSPGSAPAVIGVGATSYREGFTNYKGEYKTWHNGKGGEIAPYSSIGPTFDNRIKPDVIAPGTNVISSYSSFYIDANPDAFDTQSDVERYEYNGRTYSWNANTGTSMSSPVVGGIIALWLEANPNLTPDDVRNIMAETCLQRDKELEYPNNIYGYGEINAYRGLLRILGIDGIEGVEKESDTFTVESVEGGFDILFNNPLNLNSQVDVYGTGGIHYVTKTIPHGTSRYHVNIEKGVYAVRVKNAEGCSSLLVRVK